MAYNAFSSISDINRCISIYSHLLSRHAVNTTYTDAGSADIAYVHGWTVVGQCRSSEAVCRGAKYLPVHPIHMDVGSAENAGSNFPP
jgi:hypothetical protein